MNIRSISELLSTAIKTDEYTTELTSLTPKLSTLNLLLNENVLTSDENYRTENDFKVDSDSDLLIEVSFKKDEKYISRKISLSKILNYFSKLIFALGENIANGLTLPIAAEYFLARKKQDFGTVSLNTSAEVPIIFKQGFTVTSDLDNTYSANFYSDINSYKTLSANNIESTECTLSTLTCTNSNLTNISSTQISSNVLCGVNIYGLTSNITSLTTSTGTINSLTSIDSNITNLSATNGNISTLIANNSNLTEKTIITNLSATNGKINSLTVNDSDLTGTTTIKGTLTNGEKSIISLTADECTITLGSDKSEITCNGNVIFKNDASFSNAVIAKSFKNDKTNPSFSTNENGNITCNTINVTDTFNADNIKCTNITADGTADLTAKAAYWS